MKNIKLHSEWKYQKLGTYISEISLRNKNNQISRVLSVTNTKGFLESEEYFNKQVYSKDLNSYKIVKRNQIAYNPSRINVGSIDILDNFDEGIISPLYVIIECNNKLVPKYLIYYLKSNKGNAYIRGNTSGSVRDTLKFSALCNINLPVPSVETQKKIVKVLEKAEGILDKRRDSIKLLDELVKSRFIEMFGDENYPLVKAEDVCEYITKGTTPKLNDILTEYCEGLVPYLKVYNLSFDGSVLFDEKPQYVTVETHNKLLSRSKVFPNDVLMNIVGPPLGKFAIVPNSFKEWNINQAIAIFRATDKINPVYLLYALKQPRVLRPFIDMAVGIRQQNLSLLQCRNLEIPLPPIEPQNQFADFVDQVDKLKFEMQKSLEELENNFNSLMEKAFNGELFK